MRRVEAVREMRLSSKSAGTVKLADKPTRFHVENMPTGTYVVIPEVSSERRKYIPYECFLKEKLRGKANIYSSNENCRFAQYTLRALCDWVWHVNFAMGFMTPDILCSNLVKIVPDATLYHFGILTSNVHMAWMRAVCGRLKSDYRYSKDIVYNNFPWPTPTEAQKAKIEQTAQAILDARAMYPDCSLADLYDEVTMPPELRRAHQANDKAVMQAYGFWGKLNTETACVAELMKMYQELVKNNG